MTCTIGFNSLGIVTNFLSGRTISEMVCGMSRKVSWFVPNECTEWARTLCYSAIECYSSAYSSVTENFCEKASSAVLDCAARIDSNIAALLFATCGLSLVGSILGHVIGEHCLRVERSSLASGIKMASKVALAVAVVSGAIVFS